MYEGHLIADVEGTVKNLDMGEDERGRESSQVYGGDVLDSVGHDQGDNASPVFPRWSQFLPVILTCNLVHIRVQTINDVVSVDVKLD